MPRFITLIALLVITTAGFSQPLQVTDAWIKNLPPSLPMRAGYMQLINPDATEASIVSVSSDAFKKVEIHKTINNDGMMSMHLVKNLLLKPNRMVTLKPGGMHLMLMQPTRVLEIGDAVKVRLRFDNDTTQTILMTIKQ